MCLCTVLQAVTKINEALRCGEPRQTVRALMNPDAHLPDVYPFAAELYQRELAPLQQQQCPQVANTAPHLPQITYSYTSPCSRVVKAC